MRHIRVLIAFLLLALGAAACSHLTPPTQAAGVELTGTQPSQHPVEAHFRAGIAAFNAHDLVTFMQQWDEDIHMYAADSGWLRGQQAVRARFAETFQRFPQVRMEVEQLQVREVTPGTAVVDFLWRVYPRGEGPAFHGVGSGVYVLRDGRWVEVLEHETITRVDPELRVVR